MRINIGAGSLGMLWMAMSINMPLAMFMEAVGASGFLIGLLMTIRFTAMTAQIPSAFFSERLDSRKPLWAWFAFIHRFLWFVIAGLAFWWQPELTWLPVILIVLVGLSDLLGNAGSALWLSWMTDLIPSKISGRFWGRRQGIVMIASLLGMGIAGYALDQFRDPVSNKTTTIGFGVVFAIAAVCGVLDIIVHLWVREPRPAPSEISLGRWRRLLAPLKNRDFRHLTLGIGAWSYGASMLATFSIIHFKRDFPVTYTHVAALTIAGALGAIATSHLLGALTERLGPRVLCAILMVLAPLTAGSWFFVDTSFSTFHLPWGGIWSIPQVLAVQFVATFLGGCLFAGIAPCQLQLAGLLSKSSGRTMALAVHWSLAGLIAALGTLTGGWIMDACTRHPLPWVLPNGMPLSYMHVIVVLFALGVWIVALPLILSIRTPVDHVPFSEALARMFLTNPVNAFRNFYTLQVMSTLGPAHKRARAARKLGVGKSEMAVPELASRLDDPSIDVQEEAIQALGAINTPEAVEALLHELNDPTCDLIPQIARALRHSNDPRCVDPLIAQLQSRDRETLTESIRTLGHLGDRRAIPYLLDLIAGNRDRKVLAVSSEALAALGELSAAYQIIPQMRAMPNRMLKQALAVAVGDLLGPRESFYQRVISDTESPGVGVSQLVQDLGKVIRRRFPKAALQLETLELIESAYHDGEIPRCAELLLHLGLHLIGFIHPLPFTLDPNKAMEQLLERDRRAAIGIWYLKICNEPWTGSGQDTRDGTDILLGLHIILSFTTPHRRTAPSSL